MLLAQAFKEMFLSFFRAGREAWRRGGRTVQIAVLLAVVLAVGFFAAKRYREAFSHEPPEWLRQEQFTSAALTRDAASDFVDALNLGERYGMQRGLPVGSVRMWEVQADGKQVLHWSTDRFMNPGFDGLRHFERSLRIGSTNLLGYYSREAKPLDCTMKHSPTRTNELLLTVHMPTPVAAGSNETVFRVERQYDRVRTNKEERLQLWLGRIPRAESAIHVWAIRLPENTRLVKLAPENGAEISSNGVVRVQWINARMGTSPPPVSVIFEVPR